jgi:hypothetical protein
MEEACEKVEEWGNGFVLLVTSLMILWLTAGLWVLSLSSVLVSVIFAGLFTSVLFSAFYLTCRHCYYYGKRCYLAVGLLVPYVFKKVEGPVSPWRATLWFVHIIIAIAFPLVFIFRDHAIAQAFLYSLAVLAPPVVFFVLLNRYSCPRCKHTGCVSNPERKTASSTVGP